MTIKKTRSKLINKIKKSEKIFLMGHYNLDLDALGSILGLYVLLQKKKKTPYIIIDEKKHEKGVEKVLIELDGFINIIKTKEIEKIKHEKEAKNLLIILDTNNKNIVQSPKALTIIKNKIVIDHHTISNNSIKDALQIIDSKSSSTCEMITNLIEMEDIELEPYYATLLLAGIVLDTNNFTLKTREETYYSAYFLSVFGASAKKVQYLLKQDIKEYTERQKLLTNIETINNNIAITKGSIKTIYRKEDLARIADTLLYFNNIEISFVVAKISKTDIGISSRSLGNYDVNQILIKLNGGGDTYHGAAVIENTTINEVINKLREIIEEEF